jgi:hypothetical protein
MVKVSDGSALTGAELPRRHDEHSSEDGDEVPDR